MSRIRSCWLAELLLPVLTAAFAAAALAPLIHLLSASAAHAAGTSVPAPAALAVLGLCAFWLTRLLSQEAVGLRLSRFLSLLGWIVATFVWLTAQFGVSSFRTITGGGSLQRLILFALALSIIAWWQGLRYGSDPEPFLPDALRGAVRWAWIGLTAQLLLAAVVGGSGGKAALASGRGAVPVAVICGLLAIAASQIEQARRTATRRGGRAPGRGSWLGFAGLAAVLIVVVALVGGGLVGNNAWQNLAEPIAFTFRWLSVALLYAMIGFAFVLFLLLSPFFWLARLLLHSNGPRKPQSVAQAPNFSQLKHNAHNGLSPDTVLALRWGLIAVAAVLVAIFLFSALRRYRATRTDDEADEQRESLWSRDLARGQLRRLFTRGRAHAPSLRRADLTAEPADVREAYRFLTIQAAREELPRTPAETPADFSRRIGRAWPGAAPPVADLTERYQRIRYGEQPDEPERPAVRDDWTAIRRDRANDDAH